MVTEVLMHFRKSAVRNEQTTEDGESPTAIVVGTRNPERMALMDRISLNEVIRRLPPGYRVVFLLHDVAGYQHEQIGKILGCAVGTSKSQLYKARMKLRELVTKRITRQQTKQNLRARPLTLKFRQETA